MNSIEKEVNLLPRMPGAGSCPVPSAGVCTCPFIKTRSAPTSLFAFLSCWVCDAAAASFQSGHFNEVKNGPSIAAQPPMERMRRLACDPVGNTGHKF